uniref:Mixed lineage kinase domain like pseudokinase n=1 Tax=Cyanoderma ruficeps TaxID=181631 RepID=A0A8C3QET6_9PASS
MDIVERVLSVAQAIYAQFEQVKCCKHQCQRLVERIQILLEPVRILRAQPRQHISHHEEELMKKLLQALEEAQKLVMKYSQTSWIQKFLRARSTGEEFVWVNESLEDIAQGLSLLLQAEQKQAFLEVFQSKTCRRQDAEDLKDDRAFLDQVIASELPQVPCCHQNLQEAIDHRPSVSCAGWERVGPQEGGTALCHTLFQGSHHAVHFHSKVRDIFEKEIQTLKKFESPNILRMYGICIEENDGSPCFSIIMEYCKHGTLRDVLNKQQHLSWDIRIRMALGAARGFYFSFSLSHSLNQLSGFELCETESSIKRKAKKDWKQVFMLAYIAPETMKDINYPYKRPCEIYRSEFHPDSPVCTCCLGCTAEEIVEKICNHHYWDPLGEDCPEDLRKVIERCRAFDPSQRPSAEGKSCRSPKVEEQPQHSAGTYPALGFEQ